MGIFHAVQTRPWALDPETYPNLIALRAELATSASADQFEYGLARLVGSLRPDRVVRRRRS
ncbi:MAG: hypothetical protein LC792_04485 [Actinobacteria bacterium]|nr:hypothetical protein [Actinomycetota bacterium]